MGFEVALAEEIWAAKYRFAPADGAADEDFAATATRVALAIAEAEAPEDRSVWFLDAEFCGQLVGRLCLMNVCERCLLI